MGKCPAETSGTTLLLRTSWEEEAVARLSELLSHGKLEDLLGPLLQPLRRARQVKTGTDRRGTRRELAAALVLQHGVDLFLRS